MFVFGVLPSFKVRITGFLFSFLVFSLFGLFKSGFFVAGASKTQSFGVFTVFYYKNKRIYKGKREDKDFKHNNQQVKQHDIK